MCRNGVTPRSHLKMNGECSGCEQRARAGRGQHGTPARTPQTRAERVGRMARTKLPR